MFKLSVLCFSFVIFLSVHSFYIKKSTSTRKVVYGVDDRVDVCQSTNEMMKQITRESIAAHIQLSILGTPDANGNYNSRIENYNKLGASRNLCADERFRNHPIAASCSATLIAPDRVLTAGHCMSDFSCKGRGFVFNYFYDGSSCQFPNITANDVYRCDRYQRIENDYVDWAIVRLDRPVVGKKPVPVRTDASPLNKLDPIYLVGFGSGIPAKIDTGGYVIDPRPNNLDFFVASTDTFAGNSGSGAFNSAGVLVGVLVRGQTDYVASGGCKRVNVVGCTDQHCSSLTDAEELTYSHLPMLAVPNCRDVSDCGQNYNSCLRYCDPQSDDCTGWCSR